MTRRPMPRLNGLPLVGMLPALRRDRLGVLLNASRTYGDIVAMRMGPRTVVLLSSPDFAHEVLVKQADAFEKGPSLRVYARPLLGNGLLTVNNQFHRRQRRLVAPAFQPARVQTYVATMARCVEDAQRQWTEGSTVDAAAEMTRLTLGIAGRTLFDADLLGEAGDLGQALTVAMRHATGQLTTPLPIPLHWPTLANRRVRRAISRLDTTVYRIIHERRASGEDRGDFLSMLLHAQDEDDGESLTDRQVRDEVMTLFLASHETTANGLAWSLYLLARNPDVFDRLRAEACRVLQGRAPTLEDLAHLPYALQVFKEALRLYPPAYAIARQAFRDIEVGGYTLPTGTIVLVSPYVMHRKSEYFPDPERFDPERFTPDAEKRLPRYVYLPFSGGPRNCIGSYFALLEGQVALAALAQRVRLELLPGQAIQPEPLLTLRPNAPIKMKVNRG